MLLLFWNGAGGTPPVTGAVHIFPTLGVMRLSLGSVCILPIYGGLQL